MQTRQDTDRIARELQDVGFDAAQALRYDQAFEATLHASVCLLRAKYGANQDELLQALRYSRKLAAELNAMVARIEVCPAFVGYIHSALEF